MPRRNAPIISCLVGALLLLTACSEPPVQLAELTGRTMGTSYSIKLSPVPGQAARAILQRQIDDRLAEINRQMSTYLPDSDLMQFNRATTTGWQQVPESILDLVERANRISELSDGMYDITVGPLVNLWGFGNAGSRESPPDEHQIEALLPRIGYRYLHTRRSPGAMRKDVAQLQVDLSSIAKGWAVDQIAALLTSLGYTNYLVEIGGEVYGHGERPTGTAWRVAVEQPLYEGRAVERVVALRDMAMATSGDYRNFFAAGEQRYSHTIDPKTGQAVQHQLASVTVLADNCTDADAWATALTALGEERAPQLAESLDLMALFIVRTDQGFRELASPAMAGFLDRQANGAAPKP